MQGRKKYRRNGGDESDPLEESILRYGKRAVFHGRKILFSGDKTVSQRGECGKHDGERRYDIWIKSVSIDIDKSYKYVLQWKYDQYEHRAVVRS